MPHDQSRPTIGLLVTCLVDSWRPNIAFAALRLLEKAGYQVEVPLTQTCCGQPAYNQGDWKNTRLLAQQIILAFDHFDYLVAPASTCLAMVKYHYPQLFEQDSHWYTRAQALAQRSYELTTFLSEIAHCQDIAAHFPYRVTYHDTCAGLNQLHLHAAPRQLLNQVSALQLIELPKTNCCGFGGTFCLKYPHLSTRLVSDKVQQIQSTQAQVVLGGDLGCLLNITGRLKRLHSPIRVYHIAEILANQIDLPAIGEPTAVT